MWQEDSERLREDQPCGQKTEENDEDCKQRKEVLGLIRGGQLGRAARRVTSHGVADAHDPVVLQQLREKFPEKQHDLPTSVPKVAAVTSFSCLQESLLALDPGTSPGSGGCRPEYLTALGERMEPQDLELLEQFFLAYTAGELPPWFYLLWLSLQTVPLYKDEGMVDVRPLGVRHSLTRLFHREVIRQNKQEIMAQKMSK